MKRIHVQLVPAVRWIRCNADREALSLVLSMHGSACLGRQKWRWIRPAWLLPRVETMAVERAHSTRRRRSIASSARVHSIPPIVQPLLRDLAKFFWLVRSLCSHVAGATTEARAPRCRFITAMARVFELATRPRPLRPCRFHPTRARGPRTVVHAGLGWGAPDNRGRFLPVQRCPVVGG